MTDKQATLDDLKKKIVTFINKRDWSQFHTPKNLSMAIATEAAELMEHFRWEKDGEDTAKLKTNRSQVEAELADILAFVLSFAYHYQIDLSKALSKKMKINEKRYPVKKSKGNAKKYLEL